jgi:hypothetical protein
MLFTLCSLPIIPVLLGLFNLIVSTDIPADVIREGSRRLHDNGRLERAYIDEPVEINGIEFEGWTWFDSTGTLKQSELSEDFPFGEIILPKGSLIHFKNDIIDHVNLAHDMDIDGIPIDGGKKINTGFHPNKQLRSCYLREATEIQGVVVKGGVMSTVIFDEDGNLVNCTLAQDYTHNGSLWPAGTEIWLKPDGSVIQSHRPGWLSRMGRSMIEVVF